MPSPAPAQGASRPVLVLGCGGHAMVVIEALRASGAHVLGAVSKDASGVGTAVAGVSVVGTDESVLQHDPSTVLLANGLGSTGDPGRRKALFEQFKRAAYTFATIVHPSAVIAHGTHLGEGAQVMAGAVIQPGCRIGANTIINTRAGIDHDARIGEHVHVAPGATVCGDVTVGDACHVGAGATLIQGVRLAPGCIVGAGAVVLSSFDQPAVLCGVPARARTARAG